MPTERRPCGFCLEVPPASYTNPNVRILACLICVCCAASLGAARPPNIVHIIGDDVGYDDLSCFGATDISTPNLDKLASQGMKFTSFYAPSPTCTPTRAGVMTRATSLCISSPR